MLDHLAPGERLQLWIGVFVSLITYIAFLATRPYKFPICTTVQTVALLQLLLTYITAFIFFREVTTGRDRTGIDMRNDNSMGVVLVALSCLATVLTIEQGTYEFNAQVCALVGS